MKTEILLRPEGEITYEIAGDAGPLIVCVPGMGDLRAEYRLLTPQLVAAGFRVVAMDIRGHGESSTGWSDFSAAAVGSDIVALIQELKEPAFVVGTSMAAAAAVWAAAEAPAFVQGLVLIGPFVRDIPMPKAMAALLKLILARPWGAAVWSKVYASLYKGTKPADLPQYCRALQANLKQRGRLEALQAMIAASKADCEARLAAVKAPVLVVMGTRDPDFPDPVAEARLIAERVASADVLLVEGAGHYPHVEQPLVVSERLRALLEASLSAPG